MSKMRPAVLSLLAAFAGCNENHIPLTTKSMETNLPTQDSKVNNVSPPNDLGFAKVSIRDGDTYLEGIVDGQGKAIIQPRANLLVADITGALALVQVDRKFLFVPLDQGSIASEDLDQVTGFQYAEPFQCGLAMVSVDDSRFYLNADFQKAFGAEFQFAESFHHDRALVMENNRYRIIDTRGETVAELNYDQVNLQSPWCWQVTKIEGRKYLSGFVDLNGDLVTDLIYDEVGYYDPDVQRIRVGSGDRFGFLDERAKVVIPIQYEYAEVFHRGKARVELNGRSFFIDSNGVEVPE